MGKILLSLLFLTQTAAAVVPCDLPAGFLPNNPDFIYDLCIRGSE